MLNKKTNGLDGVDSSCILGGLSQKDDFSMLFECERKHKDRKRHAQFFTYKELVNFIVSKLVITKKTKIIDPACGAGAFLGSVYKKYLNPDNLYGIDIDPYAIELCEKNIDGKCKNLIVCDTIKNFSLRKIFPDVYDVGGFDVVIGNPPFKNLKKDVDYDSGCNIYSAVSNGVVNSSTLMIAKSLEILKENGTLAFVLPKNILRVASFSNLRNFLIKNTTIISITDIGHYFKDVRCDQIVLILKKASPDPNSKISIEIFDKKLLKKNVRVYEIKQADLNKFDFYPVFCDKALFEIYEKFKSIPQSLDDVCQGEIFRGLSIASRDNYIKDINDRKAVPILKGVSIGRFGIRRIFYINGDIVDQKKARRLKKEKIIIQNICSREGGIVAALSSKEELNIDTVTNIIPKNVHYKYILGILNSKISNIFIIYLMFLHSNFTMHTDRQYIGKLPIVIPSNDQQTRVVSLVDKLLDIENKYSKKFIDLYEDLNNVLFDVYNFNKKDRDIINSVLGNNVSSKENG